MPATETQDGLGQAVELVHLVVNQNLQGNRESVLGNHLQSHSDCASYNSAHQYIL
jgi:hypothetical protein